MTTKTKAEFFKYNEKSCDVLKQIDNGYTVILWADIHDEWICSPEITQKIKIQYESLWKKYQEERKCRHIPPFLICPFDNVWLVFDHFYITQHEDDRFSDFILALIMREAKLRGVTKLAIPQPYTPLPHYKNLIFEIFGEESMEILMCVEDEGILNIIEPDLEKQNFKNKSKYY